MKLLYATKPSELPTDALLARLRGRRAEINLSSDMVDTQVITPSSWVYQRLNRRLRKRLSPFLDLLATRNLTLALRYVLAGDPPATSLINDSLLNRPLLKLLTSNREPDVIVCQLEAMLVDDYPYVYGLSQTYRSQGPGGVEQQLTEGALQQGVTAAGDPLLERVLRYLVDLRNLLTINKLWNWQVRQAPALIAGGSISPPSLKRVWSAKDFERLTRLVTRRSGFPQAETTTVKMEQLLLKGMMRMLRRAGRDPLGLAVIIEYLWLTQLAQHNLILRQALSPDREELLQEVLLV